MSDLFSENTASRHRELVAAIRHHNELYYLRAAPAISDYDYDALLRELTALEKEHPELRSPDSPTQTVGAPLDGGAPTAGKKITHRERMLSLHNSYDAADLKKFCDRVGAGLHSKNLASGGFMTELKIDGLAVALLYEHGRLTLGATRGDGREGEDLTDNLRQVAGVPARLTPTKNLPQLPALLEVRGEVYLPRENFSRLCAEQEANGDAVFANPRNAAAGTLKVKNPAIVRARGLAAFFYATPDAAAMNAASQAEILTVLGELGLPTNPHVKLCATYEEIIARRDELDALRRHLPYDTDGMVVKVNAVAAQRELGNDAKAPVWAAAYKFLPEQAETTLANIRWQVGKFGTLTPVADLTPVWLSGSTIASATLHNFDYLRAKDLRVGDRVVVEKAGEIIPQVIKNLPEKRRGDEAVCPPPAVCPRCGTDVRKDAEKIAYYCPNGACPAQLRERLLHFAARDAMDLTGFGEETIDQLLALKMVGSVADLFYLTPEQLAMLASKPEKIGEKRAAEIIASLSWLRGHPPFADAATLQEILAAQKIATAKIRAALAEKYFRAPEKLGAATADEIAAIDLNIYELNVKNLTAALAAAKTRTLAQLLTALTIPHIGENYARVVAEHFSTIDDLMNANFDKEAEKYALARVLKALKIPHNGDKRILAIADFFPTLDAIKTAVLPENADLTVAKIAALPLGKQKVGEKAAQAFVDFFADPRKYQNVAPLIGLISTGETFSFRSEAGKLSEVKLTLGEIAAQSLVDFFADEHNRKIIERLRAAGVNMTQPQKAIATASAIAGKTVVLTGTLPNLKRDEAKKIIAQAGGKVVGSVAKTTNYVVAGADAGSKLDQARQYGVAVIDEAAMLKLCGR
ncbi:hypothetical protein AGMMS49959_15620 [Planctomycetales bacterium]|nr:hypothetical protein AGMMS49959_15620 [Planctomycetales bacterium]